MRILWAVLAVVLCGGPLYGKAGILILKDGQRMSGDICVRSDGTVWFTRRDGSVSFERSEIRRIVYHARQDHAGEAFISSYKITPTGSAPGRARMTPYEEIIAVEARRNNLDPALVKAVIKAESNFNPQDRSCKGACGLMQLMPQTAAGLGVKDIYSPQENIKGGTRFLRAMLTTFNGDFNKAIAAYNAGPGAVRRYNDIPPYRETQQYVKNVSRYYRHFSDPGRVISFTDSSGALNFYNAR